jgi:hypothetical protein
VNIDRRLANRALAGAGEDPLTHADYIGQTLRFRVMKDFYLQAFLEALSEVPWTRGKKRAALEQSGDPNLSPYRWMYDTPADCARPLEIQENDYFVVEGPHILTDREDAVLLYITNGKIAGPEGYLTDDDYPEYEPPEYEPKFYEYIERLLAAKMAMHIKPDKGLYQLLFSSAMLIKDEAVRASRSASAAKKNGNAWWFDRLGIHNG